MKVVCMESKYRNEVRNLEDPILQLRYILGGFNGNKGEACGWDRFWSCSFRCACGPVLDDERLKKVLNFIHNHNISNETFLRLLLTYRVGNFVPYEGGLCPLTYELDEAIEDYGFTMYWDEDYLDSEEKEEELIDLILQSADVVGSPLNNFLTKYNLLPIDFMILAKTSIHRKYKSGMGFSEKDMSQDLINLLKMYNMYSDPNIGSRSILTETKETEKGKPKSLTKKI